MTTIHPTAIVDAGAELGTDVTVGAFSILHDDVVVGDGCQLGPHVTLLPGTRLGRNVTVHQGAVLGGQPQDLKFAGEKTLLEVGDGTTLREYVTLNRGTSALGKTVVGRNCFLMAYVHVAHDCIIHDNVIISNAVQMAGHVEIDEYTGVGGLTAIHQFVHIGKHVFIGGGLRVGKDVPPFVLAMGEPLRYGGPNSVGLSRKGFSMDQIADIKRAYKILYRSNLTVREAVAAMQSDFADSPHVGEILNFIERSERGMIRD